MLDRLYDRKTSGAVFAATFIALGILGLIQRDFSPIWQIAPKHSIPREVAALACALISLLSGIGLLRERGADVASRTLLAYLVTWLLIFRVTRFFVAPLAQDTWSGFAETSAIVAGAWVLYAWLATHRDRDLRIARVLLGVALIPFGVAHFRYLEETASLVPGWLPWHTAWAFATGCAFIAAGIAVLTGVYARLAATLAALQLGVFTALVWVPAVATRPNTFQWSEFAVSWTVTTAAWVVADSYF